MAQVTDQRAVPKYSQVADSLRARIVQGELRPGDRLPSYAEMRALGVSQPTMDRVHSILEREGFIDKRHGSGVFVTEHCAKNGRRHGVLGLIGLEDESWGHPYWASLLAGVRRAAHQAQCDVMFLGSSAPYRWQQLDGLLLGGYSGKDAALDRPELLPAVGLMTVGLPNAISVTSDDYDAAMQATQHLLDLGHRRIANLCSGPNDRITGYEQALIAAGIEPQQKWRRKFLTGSLVQGRKFTDYTYDTMTRWLADDWKALGCTALLCHNDEIALGALRALKEAGLRVPQDVSLVGFDGTELAAHADPPLTTVAVPLEEIGARGVELLLQQIQSDTGETESRTEALPGRLKVGRSTAPLVQTDHSVRAKFTGQRKEEYNVTHV